VTVKNYLLNFKNLLLITLLVIIIGCKIERHPKTSINTIQDSCKIYNQDEDFKQAYFPFSFKYFNSSSMASFFGNNVQIDSIEKIGYDDYKYRIYSFSDSKSNIDFMVKSYDSTAMWFFLEGASIRSNLFESANDISIGMAKGEFLRKSNLPNFDCFTIKIFEGDMIVILRTLPDKTCIILREILTLQKVFFHCALHEAY